MVKSYIIVLFFSNQFHLAARPAAGRERIKQTILKSESRWSLLTMPSHRMVP